MVKLNNERNILEVRYENEDEKDFKENWITC